MAISYVGHLTGNGGANPSWFGNGPISFDPYTPTAGNAILVLAADLIGTGKTLAVTSTIGSYALVTPPGDAGLNAQTLGAFSSFGVAATAQTVTVNSSPTGDFLNIFGFEFSGAQSVSATITGASSSSTTTGSIIGSAQVVPTGSMLFALCFDQTQTINHPPVIDNGTAAYTNFAYALGVTFSGTGSSITPLFTPAGAAATNYAIVQILLSPLNLVAGVGSYAFTGENATLLPIQNLVAAAGSYAIAGNTVNLVPALTPLVLLANAGSYNYVGAPSVAGYSFSSAAGSYSLSGENVMLMTITQLALAASSGIYRIVGIAQTLGPAPVLTTVPNIVGLTEPQINTVLAS